MLVTLGNDSYFALEFTRANGARDVRFTLESSSDLLTWTESEIAFGIPTANPDGTVTQTLRDTSPANDRRYLRLRMSTPQPQP